MKTFESPNEWIAFRKTHLKSKSLGFVPTMGALHSGHLSLIEKSTQENDFTLVSIFVNPTQFNDSKDFENYPNTLNDDINHLTAFKDIALFLPNNSQLYPDKYRYKVSEEKVSHLLCGEFRPGHFEGMLTIVLKLLLIAGADRAYFGEKDYQQFVLVKDMAEAFFIPTQIVPCPLIREEEGLALSSRNCHLSNEQKEKAQHINKILKSSSSTTEAQHDLERLGFQVEYVTDLWNRRLTAVTIGKVRLIDNVELER